MSTELPKYQPYVPVNNEGDNDIRENNGAGSTKPYIPNGYPWPEQNEPKGN